jgi:hypothetical protein
MLKIKMRSLIGIFLSLFFLPLGGKAIALESFLVGPRAMGMGGANVASASDTTAQYYNPAAFGFFAYEGSNGDRVSSGNNGLIRKDWGVDANAAAGYRLHQDFGGFLDNLAKIDRDGLSSNGIQNETDLANLVNDLGGLDNPGNGITADATGGFGIRILHFGIGARIFTQATARVLNLDTTNLGISVNGADLSADINSVTITGNDGLTTLFSSAQQTQLSAAGLDATAIQRLDFSARQHGVQADQVQQVVDILASVSTQSGGTTLQSNTTTAILQGLALLEIPVSYGYALNDHWSIGGSLKLMKGRVYGTQVVVFGKDSGDIIESADDDFEDSFNVGIDLGVMGRYRMFNLGLVARNLNSPSFDGPTVNGTKFDDITVDPQVTVGIAFMPFQTLTLETDLDLTENETSFPGYQTRNIAFGLEWDLFRILALRAGTYKNLAEDDIGWVYTAGVGLNLWLVRFDIAGALTDDKEQFDGNSIPKEVRVAAQLSVDF